MSKFIEPSVEEIKLEKVYQDMGLSDQEYEKVCDILGRQPNFTETGIFSVMWSEHCSYKHSKPFLKQFPTSGEHVLMGPGEGAGVVDIGDNQAVVFKVEFTIIHQQLSHIKVLLQALVESFVTLSLLGLDLLIC